jgi:bifunctional enzyme CysN/CysC
MNIAQATQTIESEMQRLLEEHSRKEMLRLITCGSVDDGKSTLIGRLLLEAGAVYDDQIVALQQDSRRHGTTGHELDPALLLDGLEDERQQGITIDVAYRYLATSRRKFIIADTPGHEQFTRNMATGASTADLAVILVDASKGLLTQTKRHAFIVSLLGIRHVVLAVNKMDLVDYDATVFEDICNAFRDFAARLDLTDIRFVPLSALQGDNVAEPSANTPWYEGNSLLHLLETIYVGSDQNLRDLRFPVQWVNRPRPDFRGFSGTVASGTVRVGDPVVVLPSRKESRVRSIETMTGPLSEATARQSVTLTLEDEIDINRGDMIVRPGNLPGVAGQADAMLVWMSETRLQPGRKYWFKQLGQKTSVEISEVRYAVDVNTLHRQSSASLELNEIGRCRIQTHDPVIYDPYRQNRHTGSFIVVDRISHETVAAGMFIESGQPGRPGQHWSTQTPAGFSVTPVTSCVSPRDRAQTYGHRPLTLLISGLSAAGKTTVARRIEEALFQLGRKTVLLDGQTMRSGLSRDLGFSAEERSENLRRAGEVARLLNDSGLICIASFEAPQAEVRDKVRQLIGPDRFFHVYLSTPLEVCRQRDPSGIYAAAQRGELTGVAGVDREFEVPTDADLTVSTESATTEEIVALVLRQIFQVQDDSTGLQDGATA